MTAEDPLIGYTLAGRYKIIRFSGSEALGKVYSAESNQGFVRVKVLDPHVMDNPEWITRFEREVRASAAIEHPNTLRMIDFGEHRIFHYLVQEYVQGRTLSTELAYLEVLPLDRVAAISSQVASALAAAHEQDFIHRNLNPDTILLLDNADEDYVKVRDFGLAFVDETARDGLDDAVTATGTVVGTAPYMAPEYIQSGDIDPRGDLYALGCVMYEMLTGSPPFTANTEGVLLSHHVERAPVPLRKVDGRIPAWMDELVGRLLAKDPDDRPFNGHEVVQAIEDGLGYRIPLPELRAVELSATPAPLRSTTGRSAPSRVIGAEGELPTGPFGGGRSALDLGDDSLLPIVAGVLGGVFLMLLLALAAVLFLL